MSLPTRCATAPFDHAKADVILRSSDNVDFRVFMLLLSLASPFFESLFDIPQPHDAHKEQEIKDGLAVIRVTEDSKTLDALLRFCYPCTLADHPTLKVLKDVASVFDAAQKYSLDAIEKKVRQAICAPELLDADPFSCFAVAHRGHLREEALLAAKATLKRSLIPSSFEGIKLISASDLLALLTYHQKCGDAVYALSNLSWIRSRYRDPSGSCLWLFGQYPFRGKYSCGCQRATRQKYAVYGPPPQWWDDFMEGIFTELRDKPCRATTIDGFVKKTVQKVQAQNCSTCSPNVSQGMRDFSDLLKRKIEEVVSKINLELKF